MISVKGNLFLPVSVPLAAATVVIVVAALALGGPAVGGAVLAGVIVGAGTGASLLRARHGRDVKALGTAIDRLTADNGIADNGTADNGVDNGTTDNGTADNGTADNGTADNRDEAAERLDLGHLQSTEPHLRALAEALASAHEAATTDKLTHVASRPTLLAQLFGEVERAARYGRPLSVAFIDLDHFKAVNDTYGHAVGDAVLIAVANTLRGNTRDLDFIGRYGGEEFVLILPETAVDEAANVMEKLRLMILKLRVPSGSGDEVGVSISIGVAGGHGSHLRVDEMLRDADAAMYSAKALGRNQTYVFAEVDDESARIPRAPISRDARERAAEAGDLGRRAAEAALAAIVSPMAHYAGKPSSLIAAIAVRMARKLELPDQEVERVRVAALLHDIGKIGVPQDILDKPGELDAEEWQSIVQHPRIGQVIIDRVAAVRDAGAIILHHHERFSGHGYPHGLRGGDIPLGARIVAIADSYDAMVHDRPYRDAISHQAAIAELRTHAGVQFDPELVEMFCALYAEAVPQPDPSLLMNPMSLDEVPLTHEQAPRRRRRRAASA